MLVTNNNESINFSGAFRFKPSEFKAHEEVPKLFTQGRQVFHNVLEKGDEVVVVRNNYDKRVGNYIKENNLSNVEYYPQINTSCGLDDQKNEGLLDLIKNKATIVKRNLQEILEAISTQKNPPKIKAQRVEKEIRKISNALRLNIESPDVITSSSITKIRDGQKQRTIEIIAPNPSTSYVRVIQDSLNEQSLKCIINGKGEVVKTFDSPNELHKFNLLFNKMKSENINKLVD